LLHAMRRGRRRRRGGLTVVDAESDAGGDVLL
jgi:hypothetical protein